MNPKNLLLSTAALSLLATGVIFTPQTASAKTISQNGIVLHDDSRLPEHELAYVDVLLDKHADKATKAELRKYFKDLGLNTISDIVKKAKKDGLDVSQYKRYIK
ncbi:SPIN family peroxidase inhibitor [Macrococcus brunensis]|uniref:SPIN family peroxidase inhibitor n=1 Tax=Macrococcus brunensis TaxID=198483 RepID=UPI001EEFB09A|nr:SPIN family peroxidase inhibitor [Macrococcus brunensis]ULG74165.1 SPIN family peroxidase inhibitor [Macrococcus brunensis]